MEVSFDVTHMVDEANKEFIQYSIYAEKEGIMEFILIIAVIFFHIDDLMFFSYKTVAILCYSI